ncbi:MAG: hypothetical protein ACLR5H_05475 [Oscillospiraceae bacterium]
MPSACAISTATFWWTTPWRWISGSKRLKAVIPARHMSVGAPPFARPLLYGEQEEVRTVAGGDRTGKALTLLHKAIENHVWRQEQCVNLIPSENTPSRAVRLLSGSDPACRYAEHKKILAFMRRRCSITRAPSSSTRWSVCSPRKCAPTSAAPRWRPAPSAARCPTWRCSPP